VVLRYLMVLYAALMLASAPALAAQPRFQSEGQVMQWVQTYRLKPDPWRLPLAVRTLSELGQFGDEEGAAVHIGFIAGVIGDNQMKAEKLISAMLPPEAQSAVIKAIAFSGLPNWRGILNAFVDKMADRRVLIDKLSTGGKPSLMAMPVEEGRTLDMLWGYYLATGYYQPVQRILSALPWSEDKNDLEKLLVGSMAKWTLASNAAKNQGLLEMYKTEVALAPPKLAKPLKEVIDAVEIAETGQIKKQALAAIEELKTKGPASRRTAAWGTELGATAIAVGCVVASVTGHVELGIPCVVGGALTQAAGKVLTSESWSAKALGFGGN
jgi:hypothetical protein